VTPSPHSPETPDRQIIKSTSYQMTRTLAITAFFALAITGASATALYSTTDSNGSVVYIEETCSKVSVSSTLGALCNEAP
jgi:carbamoylphosphate synthase large subunit